MGRWARDRGREGGKAGREEGREGKRGCTELIVRGEGDPRSHEEIGGASNGQIQGPLQLNGGLGVDLEGREGGKERAREGGREGRSW